MSDKTCQKAESLEQINKELDWLLFKRELSENHLSSAAIRKRGGKKYEWLFYVALFAVFVFGLSFLYHAYGAVSYFRDARTAQKNAEMMIDLFADPLAAAQRLTANTDADWDADSSASLNTEASAAPFASPVSEARSITGNPDIIAYVHIPGTSISHIVVQGPDNIFYLRHDMHRQPNTNGAVFLDYANNADFSDKNTIIYGHNMRNGAMFHDLRFFMDEEHFNAHRTITVMTADNLLTYEIFAAFITHTAFEYIQVDFEGEADFDAFVSRLKAQSVHESPVQVTGQDNILILSTCTNAAADTRVAVAAKLLSP